MKEEGSREASGQSTTDQPKADRGRCRDPDHEFGSDHK